MRNICFTRRLQSSPQACSIELKSYSNSRKVKKTIYNQKHQRRESFIWFPSYHIYHLPSSHNILTLYCGHCVSFREWETEREMKWNEKKISKWYELMTSKNHKHSALNIAEHNQKWFYLSDMNAAIYTIPVFFLFILVNCVCGCAWIEIKENRPHTKNTCFECWL